MVNNKVLQSIQSIVNQYLFDRKISETVYFYTLHKCASTLFSSYVLKNINGLKHVDYADQIFNGTWANNEKLIFRKRGYIYGPIRLSADPTTPEYKILTIPTSDQKFIRDKIAIFFIRDPRDILVSAYYSLGYSHSFSPIKEIREKQQINRNIILEKSLDEYVLECVEGQSKQFETINKLASVCKRGVILKYEDMINNFEDFIAQLCEYIAIDKDVAEQIYQMSRPKQKEDIFSHRRSGQVGGFRKKLKEKTIKSLNCTLEETLRVFEYEA